MYKEFLNDRRGSATVTSLFATFAILVSGGFALDYANGVRIQTKLQVAADAAALAASLELPDTAAATREGLAIGQAYFTERDGEALIASDFVFGNIDTLSGTFSPNVEPFNAVRVAPVRRTARSNASPTFLLDLVGVDSLDIGAQATALARGDESCASGGLFSDRNLNSGSNNDYRDGFCLYGRNGVKIGSNNTFDTSVFIEMENDRNYESGSDNVGDNPTENTYELTFPPLVPQIVERMKDGSFDDLPDYITEGPVRVKEIINSNGQSVSIDDDGNVEPLAPNTLYVVDDVADFGSNNTIENIAVVAEKEVKAGSNNSFQNVIFASTDKVLLGSNNTFGDTNFCEDGVYTSYMFSESNIEWGSNNLFQGTLFGTQQELNLGSDVRGLAGVYAEAAGDIEYGSADSFFGCETGVKSEIGNTLQPETVYRRFALVR